MHRSVVLAEETAAYLRDHGFQRRASATATSGKDRERR